MRFGRIAAMVKERLLKASSPLALHKLFWPDTYFYDKQIEVIESVARNSVTVVVAANKVGKDFVAAWIALTYFLWPTLYGECGQTARVICTSVRSDHLRVLWGELLKHIERCIIPLAGGLLRINKFEIRKIGLDGKLCAQSYIRLTTSKHGEGLSGHHADATLFVADEASGVADVAWDASRGWAKRSLIFGNPVPTRNFFWRLSEGGEGVNVLRITGEDSINVRAGRIVIDGLLTREEYEERRRTWTRERQMVGLDAVFPSEDEMQLFPARLLQAATSRRVEEGHEVFIGVDPGEGVSRTALAVVNRTGLIELIARHTADTSDIVGLVKNVAKRHGVTPENVWFDRGGGGKQIVDLLCKQGWGCNSVGFGEPASPVRFWAGSGRAEATSFVNRRAQMYCVLRQYVESGFAIGAQYTELLRQLSKIPLSWDAEGRYKIPPKRAKSGPSLIEMIGNSPDEADALAVAVWGMHVVLEGEGEEVAGAIM